MPSALISSMQAMPAEPAPLQTSFVVFRSRPVRCSALISPAAEMIAVPCWSRGIQEYPGSAGVLDHKTFRRLYILQIYAAE
jgi:hypothetical protein